MRVGGWGFGGRERVSHHVTWITLVRPSSKGRVHPSTPRVSRNSQAAAKSSYFTSFLLRKQPCCITCGKPRSGGDASSLHHFFVLPNPHAFCNLALNCSEQNPFFRQQRSFAHFRKAAPENDSRLRDTRLLICYFFATSGIVIAS